MTGRRNALVAIVPAAERKAVPVTGGLHLELLTLGDKPLPRGGSRGKGGKNRVVRRKLSKSKAKTDKIKRKVARKRR